MVTRFRDKAGYLLVETIVAMGLLSIGMVTIHAGLRQGIMVRGMAQDYTTARFLLQQLVAEHEIQPQVVESAGSGVFQEGGGRFSYTWAIERIEIPIEPDLPADMDPRMRQSLIDNYTGHVGKLTVAVFWSRAGSDSRVEAETLLMPGRLWQPPKLEL